MDTVTQIATIATELPPASQQALLDYALLLQETDRPEVNEAAPDQSAGNSGNETKGWLEIKTIKGHQYIYRRWREGKHLKSAYVGPVKQAG